MTALAWTQLARLVTRDATVCQVNAQRKQRGRIHGSSRGGFEAHFLLKGIGMKLSLEEILCQPPPLKSVSGFSIT